MKYEVLGNPGEGNNPRLVRVHFDSGETSLVLLPSAELTGILAYRRFIQMGSSPLIQDEGSDALWEESYPKISPSEIAPVVEALSMSETYPRFAVMMFVPLDSADGEPVNLQFSWDNGTVGLDWVLLGRRNVQDQELISALAEYLGHKVMRLEMNEVRYFRIEGGDIPRLGETILLEIYKKGPAENVELLTWGI